jgi:polyphosphate kinase
MERKLYKPDYYFNRELSWLKFNDRVLEEAMDESHPLLERLKFACIFSSNLDEFFMIRVAGVKDQMYAGVQDIPADGLTPEDVASRISTHVHQAVQIQSHLITDDVLPKLSKKGIRIRKMIGMRKAQKAVMERYFQQHVFPVLTPLAIDPTHPFPQLNGLNINLLVNLYPPRQKDAHKVAVVPIPAVLPRFVELPTDNGVRDFVMMEDLVRCYIGSLFPKMKISSVTAFRVTRNADFDLAEAEADDLLKLIERELRKRRVGTVIRLELAADASPEDRSFLLETTGLSEEDLFDIPGYLDLSGFMYFMGIDMPDLKDPPFIPALHPAIHHDQSIFSSIRRGDILFHHPYDSFSHVVEFLQQASEDPKVIAIKQTLYRTSGDSPIVDALKNAVNNGKQVTALIELKARFDEANNIEWAKALDREGVNVIYGVQGLKTHCKVSMVIRKEGDRLRRYVHLSTGNYNDKTARIYTDLGLMTCDEAFGEDASSLFNLLTGYSLQKKWNKFLVAPSGLRKELAQQIKACIEHHSPQNPSKIIIVVNNVVDPTMIRLLYMASQKGIQIEMVVRGICCLKPGLKGVSESIHVRSIVGRFLEHTRIFYFKYQGSSRIFIGSADLMQRNLDRRVELVFPLENEQTKKRVRRILSVLLQDTAKARELQPDGNYLRIALNPDYSSRE